MEQRYLPANSHFLSPGTAENSKSPSNGGLVARVENDWDVWLPMLPQVNEFPWTLQDISKVLRLGRTREHFRAISPQAVERVSFLLQRPLLRIVREAKRISVRYSKCSKHEIQTSIRLVLSLSMARTCMTLASKAFSLYSMSSDRFRRCKKCFHGMKIYLPLTSPIHKLKKFSSKRLRISSRSKCCTMNLINASVVLLIL